MRSHHDRNYSQLTSSPIRLRLRLGIPKPHDLSFCFIATASTHKEFYGLTFAPQTIPASPAVLMCRNPKTNSMYFRNLRMDYHCLSFIPQSAVYLRRRSSERSLSLACPCQGLGRSTTMYIIAQLLVAKILPSFPPHLLR